MSTRLLREDPPNVSLIATATTTSMVRNGTTAARARESRREDALFVDVFAADLTGDRVHQ
jgi:O-methyltransferase involved in polyketide biosynthesis